jgi:hypothetical protein
MKLKQVFELSKGAIQNYVKDASDSAERFEKRAANTDGSLKKYLTTWAQKRRASISKAQTRLKEEQVSEARIKFTKPLHADGAWHYQSAVYTKTGERKIKAHGPFKTKKEASKHRQTNKWLGTRYTK